MYRNKDQSLGGKSGLSDGWPINSTFWPINDITVFYLFSRSIHFRKILRKVNSSNCDDSKSNSTTMQEIILKTSHHFRLFPCNWLCLRSSVLLVWCNRTVVIMSIISRWVLHLNCAMYEDLHQFEAVTNARPFSWPLIAWFWIALV